MVSSPRIRSFVQLLATCGAATGWRGYRAAPPLAELFTLGLFLRGFLQELQLVVRSAVKAIVEAQIGIPSGKVEAYFPRSLQMVYLNVCGGLTYVRDRRTDPPDLKGIETPRPTCLVVDSFSVALTRPI